MGSAPQGAAAVAPLEKPLEVEDGGTKFVLESKGTWLHAGYHLTSATAGPPLLVLPWAMAHLGWGPGLAALVVAAALSFYGCYLLSLVMEELEARGKRCFRFWDVASHVLGPNWAHYFVAPLQYFTCFLNVVALILLGGQTLKGVFVDALMDSNMKLYQFIIIFGASALFLSQFPSFHSLRYFNLLSMLLCLGFSLCAVIGSVFSGFSSQAPSKDYSIQGSPVHILFGVFNSISVISTVYANPIIVEIQATVAPPVTGKMLKGFAICYTVSLSTFFSAAISGYWAFGNLSSGIIFTNMETIVPTWFSILSNMFVCLQLIISSVVYMQPLFAKYEGIVADVNADVWSLRNALPRVIGRCMFVGISVILAAMLPFFADFSAFLGAFALIPLCIILPLLFFTLVFRSKFTPWWHPLLFVNSTIMVVSVFAVALGSIASIRQIFLDVDTYTLFANL